MLDWPFAERLHIIKRAENMWMRIIIALFQLGGSQKWRKLCTSQSSHSKV